MKLLPHYGESSNFQCFKYSRMTSLEKNIQHCLDTEAFGGVKSNVYTRDTRHESLNAKAIL